MSDALTIAAVFTGSGLALRQPSLDKLREAFGAGETLALEVQAIRSMESHRHYFAVLRNLWANLPERLASAPYAQSPETMRKHALLATGFVGQVDVIDCGKAATAERIAAAFCSAPGDYCVANARGPIVTRSYARSQSMRAMGRRDFQRSKTAVLEWCEALVTGGAT